VQITAGSMLGLHGVDAQRTAWLLLDAPLAIVASDGHRPDRPPFLDTAHAAVSARLGRRRADALFQAHALLDRLSESAG
jgi:tyrosine-protein phosphatase YwqE